MADWLNTVNPEDLRDVISVATYSGERPDPIFDMVWDPSITAKAARHEWGDKWLKHDTALLAAGIDDDDVAITVATGVGAKLNVKNSSTGNGFYCIAQIDYEEMLITAGEGTDSLTVTRGYNSTAAASHSSGATIKILHYWAEGSDYLKDFFEGATTNFNMTEIFRADVSLSGSMQAFKGLAGDNTMAKQLSEKDIQLMKMITNAIYLGTRVGTTNDKVRRMGGIRHYATKNNTGYTVDKAFLEQRVILPLLDGGADPNNICLAVPNNLYSKITALKEALVQNGGMQDTSRIIRKDWDTYEFGSANLTIMRSTCILGGCAQAFDKTRVKLLGVPGRIGVEEPLAKTGDSDKVMKLSEMTLESMNGAETSIWFTGLS